MRMVRPIVLGLSGALLVSLLAVAILIRTIPTGANEAAARPIDAGRRRPSSAWPVRSRFTATAGAASQL